MVDVRGVDVRGAFLTSTPLTSSIYRLNLSPELFVGSLPSAPGAPRPCLQRGDRIPIRRLHSEQVVNEEVVPLLLAVQPARPMIGVRDVEQVEGLVRLDE